MSARSLTKKGERPSPSSSETAARASIPSGGSTSTPRDCCDGEWMQHLLHPRYEVNKVYEVSVAGEVRGAAEALASMTQLDGEPIRPAQVRVLRQGRDTAVLSITIHEGKNRQIRRMCAAAGLHVKRLKRVQEHALKLGALPVGVWRDLTEQELHATKSK